MQAIARDQIERAARLYASNRDASAALGIAMPSFGRSCRRHGIETPYARRHRQRQQARTKPRID